MGWLEKPLSLSAPKVMSHRTFLQQLGAGLDLIASEYDKIGNAFEKAVYVHQNLAYLQYL